MAVTAHTEPEEQEKAFSAGMNKVLPKPLPIKELGKIIVDLGIHSDHKIP